MRSNTTVFLAYLDWIDREVVRVRVPGWCRDELDGLVVHRGYIGHGGRRDPERTSEWIVSHRKSGKALAFAGSQREAIALYDRAVKAAEVGRFRWSWADHRIPKRARALMQEVAA